MSKEAFKKILDDHHLDVHTFLDLRNSWNQLGWEVRAELLKEEVTKND